MVFVVKLKYIEKTADSNLFKTYQEAHCDLLLLFSLPKDICENVKITVAVLLLHLL